MDAVFATLTCELLRRRLRTMYYHADPKEVAAADGVLRCRRRSVRGAGI
jgi:hypothetical protein